MIIHPKSLYERNDSGISYGWFMLLCFLVLGAFTYLCIVALYNGVIGVANTDITAGATSQQTKNAMSFNRDVAMYLPVVMIIGAFVWSAVRGIGGSGATYQSFYTGYVVLIICCITAFIMAFAGGMLIDRLYTNLDSLGYIQGSAIPADWGIVQGNTMWWFINLFYFLCYMVPFLGLAVFFQSIAKRTSGSQYIRA